MIECMRRFLASLVLILLVVLGALYVAAGRTAPTSPDDRQTGTPGWPERGRSR